MPVSNVGGPGTAFRAPLSVKVPIAGGSQFKFIQVIDKNGNVIAAPLESVTDALTAHAGGGQASALALPSAVNRISTVATAGDSVVLPASTAERWVVIINSGANPIQVFGLAADTINDVAAATGVSQMANSVEVYWSNGAGKWYVEIGTGFAGSLVTDSFATGLTAFATGGQASATLLTGNINHVGTVATAGDSVKLPPWAAGLDIIVINKGANSMQVFGSGTDTIDGAAAATGVPQMAGSTVIYIAGPSGTWFTEGLATGFGGPGLQTMSFTPAVTAFAGGGQASAVALPSMINRVSTVATQGDSVKLPAAVVGLMITVINRGASAMQVFGAGTDTINGIATATGISQGINTTAVYVCNVAGNWEVPLAALVSSSPSLLSGDGAIPAHVSHNYAITKGSAAALTLAAPTSGTDDGLEITVFSRTAFLHAITATGLLNTGSANHNVATWAAQLGGSLVLLADQGKWVVLSQIGITFT